jgi:hypothetical protein
MRVLRHYKLAPEQQIQAIESYLTEIEAKPADGIEGIFGEPDFKPKFSKTKIISFWRDKVIAHTDRNRRKHFEDYGVSTPLLWETIKDAINILNTINSWFFEEELSYNIHDDIVSNLTTILDQLATLKKE